MYTAARDLAAALWRQRLILIKLTPILALGELVVPSCANSGGQRIRPFSSRTAASYMGGKRRIGRGEAEGGDHPNKADVNAKQRFECGKYFLL